MVPMMSRKLCVKCGNTGVDPDTNKPCDCRRTAMSYYDSVSCLEVPDQYRGIMFNKALVASDVHHSYSVKLQEIHDNIPDMCENVHNYFIASPINHSKTILAYSALEKMYRLSYPVFPVMDVLEIKRIILDMDYGREQLHGVESPENLYQTPILFAKVPRVSDWAVYDMIALLMDRRVRRGHSTVFIYDGIWNFLLKADRNGILQGLVGDGLYNTFELLAYESTATRLPDPTLIENIN